MKITLLQASPQWEAAEMNRLHLGAMIDAAPDADLLLLPEMFTTGFVTDPAGVAEEAGGPTVEWMRQVAARRDAAVAGSVAVHEGGKYFNRFHFVTPDGHCTIYDKKHLFTMGGERDKYCAGERRVMIEYRGWRIMPLVCYDLRFPVWSRSAGDCDLILYAASWPTPRIGAWDALLRARAIENQCYVAGVNRVGSDPYNDHSGHSVVIDFKGNILAGLAPEEEDQEALVTAELSHEELEGFRAKFPAWMDADKFKLEL